MQERKLSENALQVAEKRREAKGKGERERHTQLNSEFQNTVQEAATKTIPKKKKCKKAK